MGTEYLLVFILICWVTVSSQRLECFRCVYDMRKPAGAKVWNAVRRLNETNDPACFRPDRYNPPHHLVQNMQRCSPNGHCNKQMWYYRESRYDRYIARGCSDVCYNKQYPSVDLRVQGYDRVDVTYACCDQDRCNHGNKLTSKMTSLVVAVTAAVWMCGWWR